MDNMEQELFDLIMQLDTLMHRNMMGHNHRNRSFMNPHRGQGRVLLLLKMNPQISQKDLGYLLNMSKQGLAELLSKLEAAGYIVRTPSNNDGRVMMITLTENGRAIAEEIDTDDRNSFFDCLSEEEQNNLRKYLEKIIQSAEVGMPSGGRCRHRRMGGNRRCQ